jgi:hypothetical protein
VQLGHLFILIIELTNMLLLQDENELMRKLEYYGARRVHKDSGATELESLGNILAYVGYRTPDYENRHQ